MLLAAMTDTSRSKAAEASTSNDLRKDGRQQELGRAHSIEYVQYQQEHEMTYLPMIRAMLARELSEPYSIYVYRYFLYTWGHLCFLAISQRPEPEGGRKLVGVVINKLEVHRDGPMRGYIAMLAVEGEYRGKGIATDLVLKAVEAMKAEDADEIALETEITNVASLKLYERLGFSRSKKLHRYYLNGNAAFRLMLYLKERVPTQAPKPPPEDGG